MAATITTSWLLSVSVCVCFVVSVAALMMCPSVQNETERETFPQREQITNHFSSMTSLFFPKPVTTTCHIYIYICTFVFACAKIIVVVVVIGWTT